MAVPIFKKPWSKVLDKHVEGFAKDLQFDLGEKKLKLDSLWINILPQGRGCTVRVLSLRIV